MGELFDAALRQFIEQYGVAAGLVLIGFILSLRYIHKLWESRCGDKDAEIARLVEEKKRLTEALVTKRLTTGD